MGRLRGYKPSIGVSPASRDASSVTNASGVAAATRILGNTAGTQTATGMARLGVPFAVVLRGAVVAVPFPVCVRILLVIGLAVTTRLSVLAGFVVSVRMAMGRAEGRCRRVLIAWGRAAIPVHLPPGAVVADEALRAGDARPRRHDLGARGRHGHDRRPGPARGLQLRL